MRESQSLLAEYVQNRSEEAFGRLMKCYVDLVYSTALRLVRGDSHLAEDVTQTVFLHFATKASRLPPDVMLGGWLHQTTCYVASAMLRAERRRQLRERQAAELSMDINENTIFSEIAPILDEAINQLGEEERKAILLRFYERLDFLAVGEQLGSSENAAQKRVSRALDHLQSILTQRGIGVTLSAAALGTALAASAVEAAPAGVVASLAKAGLAGAAAGHGTALTYLKAMITSKAGLSVASAVVLAGAIWLAGSLWWPSGSAKSSSLAWNGTWTVLSKGQPLGHVVFPSAITLSKEGELYVADFVGGRCRIQRRDLRGVWSLVVSQGQGLDGLKWAQAMAFDASGSLYVAEPYRLCKRDRHGNWSVLATQGKELGQINYARALTLDREGSLYIAQGWREDSGLLLRKPDGQWARLADQGSEVGQVIDPQSLAVDPEGNLYVADAPSERKRIQKRDKTGHWSVLDEDAMSGGDLGSPLAPVVNIERMTCDASGALYVSAKVRPLELSSSQLLKREAGGRWKQLAAEGSGLGQVVQVNAMSVDSAGSLYVAESGNNRVQKRDSNGTWTVMCEALKEPGAFITPTSLALDSRGNLYVVDYPRHQVQKRDLQGGWTMVVDVPSQLTDLHDPSFPVGIDSNRPVPFWILGISLFREPSSVALDHEDNLYVADDEYHRIMKLNTGGGWELCVPAGRGIGQTREPGRILVDGSGNLYVLDGPGRNRLRKRSREGQWMDLTPPNPGRPEQIFSFCTTPEGSVYVLGWKGIQMRNPQGVWTVVASEGAEVGQVGKPGGLAADFAGRLYVIDNGNHRLQVRDLDGRWFVLGAGNPEEAPILAEFFPGLQIDRQGSVYLTDTHRVFRWTPRNKTKSAHVGFATKK